MSTTKKIGHTPGAIRVARLIYEMHSTAARLSGASGTGDKYESNIELLAQLIDRETHCAELLEALKGTILAINEELAAFGPETDHPMYRRHFNFVTRAEAAIRKVEG